MSKDSQTIYSCSHDETIRQWDIMAGTVIKSAKAHTSTIYQLAMSPDGKLLATVSADKTVKVRTRPNEPSRMLCVCGLWHKRQFTPAVCGTTPTVAAAAAPQHWGHGEACRMPFSCRRTHAVVRADMGSCPAPRAALSCLQLWDPKTFECMATLIGHQSHVVGVAWTPDSKKLVRELAAGVPHHHQMLSSQGDPSVGIHTVCVLNRRFQCSLACVGGNCHGRCRFMAWAVAESTHQSCHCCACAGDGQLG